MAPPISRSIRRSRMSTPARSKWRSASIGLATPDDLSLQAYSEAGHLGSFTLYAGDPQGVLRGTRLDEVASLEMNGLRFSPGKLSRADEQDQLQMSLAPPAVSEGFQAGEQITAKIALKDGRTIKLPVTIATPRPEVKLITKSIQRAPLSSQPLLQTAALTVHRRRRIRHRYRYI